MGASQGPERPRVVHIPVAGVQQLLRRPLDQGQPPARQLQGGKLPRAVKGHVPALGLLPSRGQRQNIVQQRPIGSVAPQGLARRRQAFRIEGAGALHPVPQPLFPLEIRRLPIGLPTAGQEIAHLQAPLGQGAGLVGEQDVQTAGGLDTHQLAHQHMILKHPPHVGGQHHRDHHGQPLRHRHHHHRDGQGQGVKHMAEHRRRRGEHLGHPGPVHAAVDVKGVE